MSRCLVFIVTIGAMSAMANTPYAAAATESVLILKVSDSESAGDALVKKAEAVKGFFSQRTERLITFQIPQESEAEFEAYVRTLGFICDRQYKKVDLGAQMERAQSVLKSRQEMMQRYLQVLAESGPSQIVTVERKIVELIQEMEREKAELIVMENRVRYSRVIVAFEFQDRRAPVREGVSSFKWLNTLNLKDLLDDFHAKSN